MMRHQKLALAVAAGLSFAGWASAQTIYNDEFERATLAGGTYTYSTLAYATPGAGATDAALRTGGPLGTTGNYFEITNDGTAAANVVGVASAATATNNFNGAPGTYNLTLNDSQYAGKVLQWTFNLQHNRATPSGFGDGNFGTAFILGGTNADFFQSGNGYALVRGPGADTYNLVSYTGGLRPFGSSTIPAANLIISGIDPGLNYSSVRVTFNPAANQWKLETRNDGATQFTDANTNSPAYTLAGIGINSTYAGVNLAYLGALYKHAAATNNATRWDNFALNVLNAPTPPPPRNLKWDSDLTNPATDGGGTWSTSNTWIDQADGTTRATWDDTAPDNAIFGTGAGAGASTVTLTSTQVAGRVTFSANSHTYTLSGGTLLVSGHDHDADSGTNPIGMTVQQNANISSGLTWVSLADMSVDANTTLSVSGAMGGGGQIIKKGAGTLVLTGSGAARSGHLTTEEGTTRITSATSGLPNSGSGNLFVKNTGTLHFDASAAPISITTGPIIHMGDNGTMKVTGNVTYQRNYPEFKRGTLALPQETTIHVDAGGQFLYKAQIRNDGSTGGTGTESFHTIHVDGPGTLKLTNAGQGGDDNIFSGSWDLSDGKLVLGQQNEANGTNGDTLNALGFKGGVSAVGNKVTVRGTGTLIGTENVNNGAGPAWYRSQVELSGGTLASGNGKDANWGGHFSTVAATTSTVATYDPLNPTIARNVNVVAGLPDPDFGVWNQGDTTWGGNVIVDPGTTTGGKFVLNRDGGTISVTPGVSITVNQGATLELAGTADILSDGVDHVDVTNNSTSSLNVTQGSKNVGRVRGSGNSSVSSGASLTAKGIRQGGLNIADGGRANLRVDGGADGMLLVDSLNLNTSGTLDGNDNDIVVNNGSYSTCRNQVLAGFGNALTGPGIVSSTSDGSQILALFDNAQVGAGDWLGVSIGANAIVGKYTYFGDANIDGQVTGDDYGVIDANLNTTPASGLEWLSGDMNLDGSVTGDDYGVIDANLGLGVGNPLSPSALTAVPEPGTLGVLGAAGIGMLMRRRRAR